MVPQVAVNPRKEDQVVVSNLFHPLLIPIKKSSPHQEIHPANTLPKAKHLKKMSWLETRFFSFSTVILLGCKLFSSECLGNGDLISVLPS